MPNGKYFYMQMLQYFYTFQSKLHQSTCCLSVWKCSSSSILFTPAQMRFFTDLKEKLTSSKEE